MRLFLLFLVVYCLPTMAFAEMAQEKLQKYMTSDKPPIVRTEFRKCTQNEDCAYVIAHCDAFAFVSNKAYAEDISWALKENEQRPHEIPIPCPMHVLSGVQQPAQCMRGLCESVRAESLTPSLTPVTANNFEDIQNQVMAKNGLELQDQYLQCQDTDDCTFIRGTCGWKDVAVSKSSEAKVKQVIARSESGSRCNGPDETPLMARCVHNHCMLLRAKRVD